MKTDHLIKLLFLCLIICGLSSCSKEDEEPLSVMYVENNTFYVSYPKTSYGAFTIIGGDGNYSYECHSELVELEQTHPNAILIKSVSGVGQAAVTIKDGAGHVYVLNINIRYYEERVIIAKLEAKVTGENLTLKQVQDIETDALKSIPVATGGGYKFVYKEMTGGDEPMMSGDAMVYPEEFGKDSISCTFSHRRVRSGEDTFFRQYKIMLNGVERTFILMPYKPTQPMSKMPAAYYAQFAEDVTAQYKDAYPAAELVLTSQVITGVRE